LTVVVPRGFVIAFPPVFGAEPWSAGRFLSFNVAWLVICVAGAVGIARARRPACLVAVFSHSALASGMGSVTSRCWRDMVAIFRERPPLRSRSSPAWFCFAHYSLP